METFVISDTHLRQKGIKASYQRVCIYEYFMNSKDHPSVSQVFADLHHRIPSLSRATVYNTVNLLVNKRLLTPVQVDGPEVRYDLSEPDHAHFHCSCCRGIFDVPVEDVRPPEELRDFAVQEVQLHFMGLCPGCR